jgi:hypothetical protein
MGPRAATQRSATANGTPSSAPSDGISTPLARAPTASLGTSLLSCVLDSRAREIDARPALRTDASMATEESADVCDLLGTVLISNRAGISALRASLASSSSESMKAGTSPGSRSRDQVLVREAALRRDRVQDRHRMPSDDHADATEGPSLVSGRDETAPAGGARTVSTKGEGSDLRTARGRRSQQGWRISASAILRSTWCDVTGSKISPLSQSSSKASTTAGSKRRSLPARTMSRTVSSGRPAR